MIAKIRVVQTTIIHTDRVSYNNILSMEEKKCRMWWEKPVTLELPVLCTCNNSLTK